MVISRLAFLGVILNAATLPASLQIEPRGPEDGTRFVSDNTPRQSGSKDFQAFLKSHGQSNLKSVLHVRQWSQSTKYGQQWQVAWTVAARLERELRLASLVEIKKREPWIFSGRHQSTSAFCLVRAIVLKDKFQRRRNQANEGFALRPPSEGMEGAAALVKQWRSLISELRAIAGPLSKFRNYSRSKGDIVQRTQAVKLQTELDAMVAWCLYYGWRSGTSASRQREDLQSARNIFLKLLGISLADLGNERLNRAVDFDRQSRTRLVTGLGVVLVALGDHQRANACFELLRSVATGDRRSDLMALHVLRLCESRQWEQAKRLASDYLERSLIGQPAEGLRFSRQVTQALFPRLNASNGKAGPPPLAGSPQRALPQDAIQLVRLLVRHLAKVGEVDAAVQLLHQSAVSVPGTSVVDRILRLAVFLSQLPAEDLQPKQVVSSQSFLRTVAESSSQQVTSELKIWCLFALGEMQFKKEKAECLKSWQKAYSLSAKVKSIEKASELAWKIARVFCKFAEMDTKAKQRSQQWLKRVQDNFPDTQWAELARVQARLLSLQSRPMEQLRFLKNVPESSPAYRFSQRQRLGLLHTLWLRSWRVGKEREQLSVLVCDSCKAELVAISDQSKQHGNNTPLVAKLRSDSARSLIVSILLDVIGNSDSGLLPEKIDSLYLYAQQHIDQVSDLKVGPQLHVRALQHWAKRKQNDLVIQIAGHVISQKSTALQRREALSLQTQAYQRQLENEWSSLSGTNIATALLREKTRKCIESYRQLLVDSEDLADTAAKKRSQLYWLVRRSRWLACLGDRSAAVADLVRANQIVPEQLAIQLPLARLLVESGQLQESLAYWRPIESASKPGSNQWFEANYHRIVELTGRDPAKAAVEYWKVLALFPEVSVQWSDRYKELRRKRQW